MPSTSFERDAGSIDRLVGCTARAEALQRGRVHIGVLPNLQRGEVESERLDLPHEILDLAGSHPIGSVAAKRLLHPA